MERRRILRLGADVVGVAGVAVGGLGLLARSVAVGWQPAIVAAAASVYLAAGAVVGGAVLAGRRRWSGVVVATLVVAWTVAVHVPLFVGAAPRTGPSLVVLQANLGVGGVDAAVLVGLVRDHDVDVLTADELTPAALDRLGAAGLDTVLPHRFVTPYAGGAGTGIWSRYPLSRTTARDEFSFGLLTGGFHDASERAGGGFAPTYPTDRFTGPLLVLDHVLARGADAADVRTVDLPGSDHRGLLVRLQVTPA